MKGILFLLVFAIGIVGLAQADPRMESRGGIVHFIFDAVNTDDELKLNGVRIPIYVDDNGMAWGYVSDEFQYNSAALPDDVTRLDFNQDDSDSVCTLVDDGGTVYVSETWRSVVRMGPVDQNGEQLVKVSLRCDYGVAQ